MTSPDSCKRYRDSDLVFYEELLLEKREAFSCLYLQTYRQCIPYVLQRGSDQEQAEDLLQDCLAIFVSKVRDGSYVYQKGSRITTYFQSIYINQWKKSLDQKTRRGEVRLERQFVRDTSDEESYKDETRAGTFKIAGLDDDGNAFETDLPEAITQAYDDDERNSIFQKLNQAFQLLGDSCQNMLRWFYVEDRSLRDIAGLLGITEEYAALKRLRCAKYLKEKFQSK